MSYMLEIKDKQIASISTKPSVASLGVGNVAGLIATKQACYEEAKVIISLRSRIVKPISKLRKNT